MSATASPDVTMLWESADPVIVLGQRFGFGSPDDAATWLRSIVNEHWDTDVLACERIVLSASNALAWLDTDQGRLLAKWSVDTARHPRLVELARLTAWLHERDLPVAAPIPTTDGGFQVGLPAVSIGLQPVIAGDHLDTSDDGQVRAAGRALAHLHLAMADYQRARLIGDNAARPAVSIPQLADWLASGRAARFGPAEQFLRGRVAALADDGLPPPQLVHNDLRSANVLCAGGHVAAVLDFEEAGSDCSVMDVAHSAVLLGTRFRDWHPVSTQTHQNFLDGYREIRPLSDLEQAWLPALMTFRTMLFVPDGDDPAGWRDSAAAIVGVASARGWRVSACLDS